MEVVQNTILYILQSVRYFPGMRYFLECVSGEVSHKVWDICSIAVWDTSSIQNSPTWADSQRYLPQLVSPLLTRVTRLNCLPCLWPPVRCQLVYSAVQCAGKCSVQCAVCLEVYTAVCSAVFIAVCSAILYCAVQCRVEHLISSLQRLVSLHCTMYSTCIIQEWL